MRAHRSAAIAGAVVAVGAATLMGLTGSAFASVPGECTDTVNVRAEPSLDSRIVALCEAGTAVQTGEVRNGFVEITDLGGWAAQEFIAIDESAPATTPGVTPSGGGSPSTGSTPDGDTDTGNAPQEDELRSPASTGPTTGDGSSDTGPTGDGSTGDGSRGDGSTGGFGTNSTDESEPAEVEEPAGSASGLGGGLL